MDTTSNNTEKAQLQEVDLGSQPQSKSAAGTTSSAAAAHETRRFRLGQRITVIISIIFLLSIFSIENSAMKMTRYAKYAMDSAAALQELEWNAGGGIDGGLTFAQQQDNINLFNNNNNKYSSSSSTNNNDRRLQLVIHIGPPKTATSTIQEILSTDEWADILKLDNYTYTGKFLKEGNDGPYKEPLEINRLIKSTKCHKEMSTARENAATNNDSNKPIRDILLEVPCAKELFNAIDVWRHAGQSLIISDETLAYNVRQFYGMKNQASLDWISLKELLNDYWDITVIIGYRRYYEWLPSAKQQIDRWKPSKPRMNLWVQDGGKPIDTLFPNFWKIKPGSSKKLQYPFTNQIINMIESNSAQIKIFNLHSSTTDIDSTGKVSARTIFLCDTLPYATQACKISKERDVNEIEYTSNPSQTLFYEMLTLAGEDIIRRNNNNKMPNRHDVVIAVKDYHQNILNNTEFPLVCPTKTEYNEYLQKSLDLEKLILPDFYESKLGEYIHRESYWKAVMSNKFCHIDTDKVLSQDDKWKKFFATYYGNNDNPNNFRRN